MQLKTYRRAWRKNNALLALGNGISLDSLIQANRLSIEQQQLVIRRYIEQVLT